MSYNSGRVNLISSNGGSGLPIPNATQTMHCAVMNTAAAAGVVQIATPDASHAYYYVGFMHTQASTVSPEMTIYDAAAGNPQALTAGTLYTDINLAHCRNTISGATTSVILSTPIKVANGIRMQSGTAGSNGVIAVYYMEEAI